ncbi:MAG: TolC family protein [Planctomycetes bacterium]|nr:TolC family protein [Planctomycetota bacterium]
MAIGLFLCGPLESSETNEPAAAYNLAELESLALEHNPDLRSSFRQWRAAVAKIAAARSLPDPMISYSEFIEEVQTRVGPQRRKIMLSQMFPWFGTLDLREDAAAAHAAIVAQELESIRWKILRDVQVSLFELILTDNKIAINKEHLNVLQDLEKSQKSNLSGVGHLSTLLRVQVEMERLKDSVRTLEAMKDPLLKNLEQASGFEISKDLPSTLPPRRAVPERSELQRLFMSHNPMWSSNHKGKEFAAMKMALARKEAKPNIELGFTWIDTGPALMPATAGSGADPLIISLSFSLPVWRGKNRSKLEEAQEMFASLQENEKSILNNYKAGVELILFRLYDADRKIELYSNELLPKASGAYDSSRKAHEAGLVSFQDLLDSERLVLQFSLDLQVALTDRAKAVAELERLVAFSFGGNLMESPNER